MKLQFTMLVIGMLSIAQVSGQSLAVNTTGAVSDNSAILDVSSTNKGVLIPRVSTTQRNNILSPAKGLMLFDSTLNQFAYYDGSSWQLLAAGMSSWTINGVHQYSGVSGNVGIGINLPADKLHLAGSLRIDSGKIDFRNTGGSVRIGELAGQLDDLSNRNNVLIGYGSGKKIVTGTNNVAIGTQSLYNTTSSANTSVGAYSGEALQNGFNNTVVGESAMRNSTSGYKSVAVGSSALRNNINGVENTALGMNAGLHNNGSGNVFLGHSAGFNEAGSNKLYISNSATGTPLIYGNFAADSLKVNGTLTVKNAYTFPSTDGTANYLLQTNGSGQASWVNPSSLTVSETDPQVSATAVNRMPKWDGTALVDGQVIDNGTNIGIGTTTPGEKLEVVGNTKSTRIIADNSLQVGNLLSSPTLGPVAVINTHGNAPVLIGETINNTGLMIGYDGNDIQGRSGVGFLNNADLTINRYGGNVGIGTVAPTEKLDVNGKTKTNNLQITAGANAGYVMQSDASGNGTWVNPASLSIVEADPQVSSTVHNTVPKWDGTSLVDGQITDNGTNIGIGTTAPSSKLHLKGNLKVDSGRIAFSNSGQSVIVGENAGMNDDFNNRQNTFIGFEAGKATTTGNINVFVGHAAGQANTTGNWNAALGQFALGTNTTGVGNTAIGRSALSKNTTGGNNAVLGTSALSNSVTANATVAIGSRAMFSNTSSTGNVAIGYSVAENNLTGNNNTFVGHRSGFNNNGSSNVFLGYRSGENELGSDKLYIDNSITSTPLLYGNFAADSLKVNGTLTIKNAYTFPATDGTANFVLQTNGSGQASWVNPSSLTVSETDPKVSSSTTSFIPKWNGTTLVDGQVFDNGTNIGVGTATPTEKLDVNGKTKTASVQITTGANAGYVLQSDVSGNGTWVNPASLSIAEADPQVSSATNNYVPKWNGTSLVDGKIYDDGTNIGIGTSTPGSALDVNGKTTTSQLQVSTGAQAGFVLQSDASGNGTWVNPTSLTVSESDPQVASTTTNNVPKWNGTSLVDGIIIDNGTNVGVGTATPTDKMHVVGNIKVDGGKIPFINTGESVSIGNNAGSLDDYSNNQNVHIGTNAGMLNVTGVHNVGIGQGALESNTSSYNTAVGRMALNENTLGYTNVAVGESSLRFNTSGIENAAIGTNSLRFNLTGSRNTAVGQYAGYNSVGTGNLFLGSRSGYYETGSDKLYIDNSATVSPLIYGNFAADSVIINGTLSVKNAYTFPSIAGTANYLLQTNGLGQTAWVNPASLVTSESDPQVTSATNNSVPRWNGTSLADGKIYDNGTNVGIDIVPTNKFQVGMGYEALASLDTENNTGASFLTATAPKWQSFTAANTGAINAVAMVFYNTPALTSRTIKLYQGAGTSGTLLATSTATDVPVFGASPNWVSFPISGATLTTGNLYTIEIDNGSHVIYSGTNPYPNGEGDGLSLRDYRFRVYTNTQKTGFAVSNTGVKINNYTLPLADGTLGQVLQTDGAGNTAWVNASSLESDPQVSSTTSNYIPKWNGTALIDGQIVDNGTNVGIGTATPLEKLHIINGNILADRGTNNSNTTRRISIGGARSGSGNSFAQIDFNNFDSNDGVVDYTGASIQSQNTNSTDDGDLRFLTNNGSLNERMIITNDGNIGIGTSAPTFDLSFAAANKTIGAERSATTGSYYNLTLQAGGARAGQLNQHGGDLVLSGGISTGNGGSGADLGSNVIFKTATPLGSSSSTDQTPTEKMRIAGNGNIGIGTTNPSQAKLVINGSQQHIFTSYGYLNRTTPTGTYSGAGATNDYSIYASDRIAAPEFNAYSDMRIKNIKGKSNGTEDLHTLMGIEITNYTLKDSISKGNTLYKKVIAQQVESVYPQAVSRMVDVVPDIYSLTTMDSGVVLLSNSLKAGERVKLIFESGEQLCTVLNATPHQFTVDVINSGKVFVYGRQVNDFRSVDYEAISMLNVSATQELMKKMEAQEDKINQLTELVNQLLKSKPVVAVTE